MTCQECNGTGVYVGLFAREACRACAGSVGRPMDEAIASRDEAHDLTPEEFARALYHAPPGVNSLRWRGLPWNPHTWRRRSDASLQSRSLTGARRYWTDLENAYLRLRLADRGSLGRHVPFRVTSRDGLEAPRIRGNWETLGWRPIDVPDPIITDIDPGERGQVLCIEAVDAPLVLRHGLICCPRGQDLELSPHDSCELLYASGRWLVTEWARK